MKRTKKKLKKLVIHQQWIDITKKGDGQTSVFYPPNDEFTRMMEDMDPKPDLIYRRLNFINGVPEQYTWTSPDARAEAYGGHALVRMKVEDWPLALKEERLNGNKFAVPPARQQPRPEQFGPCPCPRCTAKREAEYLAKSTQL
jgi:hypothetical protein